MPLNSFALDPTLLSQIAAAPYAPRRERPVWLQIHDRLAAALAETPLAAGARLPGENDLAGMFSVTRPTMRKALSKLQQEGHLHARKGVGIFVRARPARYRVADDLRFSSALDASGERIATRTLSLVRSAATTRSAAALELGDGAEVVRLKRLRMVDGEPVYLTDKEFPADLFPDFESAYAARQSVADVFAAHGIQTYFRARTCVSGGFAGRRDADALCLSHRTPLLRVAAITHDPEGRPIEASFGRWPLTAVELVFDRAT